MSTQSSVSRTPSRLFDPLAVMLLFAGLLIAASQLVATNWVRDLNLAWVLAILGGLLGAALGYSRFSAGLVGILAAMYGLFAIPWQLGLTIKMDILWRERLLEMYNTYLQTLDQLISNENVTSPLFFLTVVAVLAWGVSVYAGYSLTRYGNGWRAIVPGGLLMILIATYGVKHGTNTFLLGVFFFIALLLIARLTYLKRQLPLRENRTLLPSDLGYQVGKVIVISAVILILVSWSAPSVAEKMPSFATTWRKVIQPLSEFRIRISKAFSPVDTPYGIVNVALVNDYYGDTLSLGHGNILTDDEVMRIEAPALPIEVPRYYWRARHYETYLDGSWESGTTETITISPDGEIFPTAGYDSRWETEVRINPRIGLATLFTPLEPEWVSLPVQASIYNNLDGTTELVSLQAVPPLAPETSYFAGASLAAATITELREAGSEYPEWVTERYLQLPETITPRTSELARRIADGQDNPYDIAMAVTRYLRTNYTYREYLVEIPVEQDPVDWFLFIQREGFCNYYASAQVVLLRSLGIPARLTVGYAQGEKLYDVSGLNSSNVSPIPDSLKRDQYIVRQENAHAWPEVFFPGIGWVEFEPTAGQAPLLRLQGNIPDTRAAEEPFLDEDSPLLEDDLPILDDEFRPETDSASLDETEATRFTIPWNLVIFLGIIILAAILWRVNPFRNLAPFPVLLEKGMLRTGIKPPEFLRHWAMRESLPPVMRAYNELNRALVRLGHYPVSTSTPTERALVLASLVPTLKDPAEIVVGEYQIYTYRQRELDPVNAVRAGRVIRSVSYRQWIQGLLNRMNISKTGGSSH
jgi:transglutaminase-like putative cysteine protease